MNKDNSFELAMEGIGIADADGFDEAVRRGMNKARKTKARRKAMAATIVPALLISSFLLCINTSPAFARAIGRVPVLRDLAGLVTFDKGLRLALENDYFQPVGTAVSKDGLTVNIGGIMADDGALTVFWDVSGKTGDVSLFPRTALYDAEGTPLPFSAMLSSDKASDGTHKLQIILKDPALPDSVQLDLSFYRKSPVNEAVQAGLSNKKPEEEFINTYSFKLDIDESLRKKGIDYPISKTIQLKPGAALTLDKLTIYPTHARLCFNEDTANTEAIHYLSFTLTNEKGETFVSNTGMTDVYIMESAFFSNSKQLTLSCTKVSTVPKQSGSIDIDPITGTVSGSAASWLLPLSVSRSGGVLRVSFTVDSLCLLDNTSLYEPFSGNITDDAGNIFVSIGTEAHWDGDSPVYTLLLEDKPVTGLLHIDIGISPPAAAEQNSIRIK